MIIQLLFLCRDGNTLAAVKQMGKASIPRVDEYIYLSDEIQIRVREVSYMWHSPDGMADPYVAIGITCRQHYEKDVIKTLRKLGWVIEAPAHA